MDEKTFEWMSARVRKAEFLKKRMSELQQNVARLKQAKGISVSFDSTRFNVSDWGKDGRNNAIYKLEIEASMINAAIDLYNAEIVQLEAEFDQI